MFEKLKQAVMQKFYGFCIVYQTKVHKPELVACRLYVTQAQNPSKFGKPFGFSSVLLNKQFPCSLI